VNDKTLSQRLNYPLSVIHSLLWDYPYLRKSIHEFKAQINRIYPHPPLIAKKRPSGRFRLMTNPRLSFQNFETNYLESSLNVRCY